MDPIYEAYKNITEAEKLSGGKGDNKTLKDIADHHSVSIDKITTEFNAGVKVEREHSIDKETAAEIARDHLWEIPDYYTRLDKMETAAK